MFEKNQFCCRHACATTCSWRPRCQTCSPTPAGAVWRGPTGTRGWSAWTLSTPIPISSGSWCREEPSLRQTAAPPWHSKTLSNHPKTHHRPAQSRNHQNPRRLWVHSYTLMIKKNCLTLKASQCFRASGMTLVLTWPWPWGSACHVYHLLLWTILDFKGLWYIIITCTLFPGIYVPFGQSYILTSAGPLDNRSIVIGEKRHRHIPMGLTGSPKITGLCGLRLAL